MMPPMPLRDTLVFATDLRFADVYFLIDTTGSMSGPIRTVQTLLSTPTTGIIDRIRAEISEAWFGVGDFKDRFGLTRKWAIPLLEHLDHTRTTQRVGNERRLLPRS